MLNGVTERDVCEGQRSEQMWTLALLRISKMEERSIVTNAIDRLEKNCKRFHVIYQLVVNSNFYQNYFS